MTGALATSRRGHGPGSGQQSRRPIRLMIVDDSMVARAVLSRMIDADSNFEIVAVAGTAEDAIEALGQVMVDIVLLDLEMPGVGGLKSIPKILEAAKGAKVLIVSSLAEEGAEETVAALDAFRAAQEWGTTVPGFVDARVIDRLWTRLKEKGKDDEIRRTLLTIQRIR